MQLGAKIICMNCCDDMNAFSVYENHGDGRIFVKMKNETFLNEQQNMKSFSRFNILIADFVKRNKNDVLNSYRVKRIFCG